MEVYFTKLEIYNTIYNCSQLDVEEWRKTNNNSKLLGLLYLSIGLTYCGLYIPCLYIMTKHKFFFMSCYKIMFFLGKIIYEICTKKIE